VRPRALDFSGNPQRTPHPKLPNPTESPPLTAAAASPSLPSPANPSPAREATMVTDAAAMAVVRAARPALRGAHDGVAFAAHAAFLAAGYSLCAVGPDALTDPPPSGSRAAPTPPALAPYCFPSPVYAVWSPSGLCYRRTVVG
jgi:hypothetical protein